MRVLPSALERQCWCVCRVDVCHEQTLLVEKHVWSISMCALFEDVISYKGLIVSR